MAWHVQQHVLLLTTQQIASSDMHVTYAVLGMAWLLLARWGFRCMCLGPGATVSNSAPHSAGASVHWLASRVPPYLLLV